MEKGLMYWSEGAKLAWCYSLERYVYAQPWLSKRHYENNEASYGSFDIPSFAMWIPTTEQDKIR